MVKKKKSKKRNPQDATLRNIRALKKQLQMLRQDIASLEEVVKWGFKTLEKKRK